MLQASATENPTSYIFLVKAVTPFLLLRLAVLPLLQLETPEGVLVAWQRRRAHAIRVDRIHGTDRDRIAVH